MGRSLLVFCRPDCARGLPERTVFSFQYYRQIDYMLGQNRVRACVAGRILAGDEQAAAKGGANISGIGYPRVSH